MYNSAAPCLQRRMWTTSHFTSVVSGRPASKVDVVTASRETRSFTAGDIAYRSSNILLHRFYFYANRNAPVRGCAVFSECRNMSVYHQQQISSHPSVHLQAQTCFLNRDFHGGKLLSCVRAAGENCANASIWLIHAQIRLVGSTVSAKMPGPLPEARRCFSSGSGLKQKLNLLQRYLPVFLVHTEHTGSMSRLQAETSAKNP